MRFVIQVRIEPDDTSDSSVVDVATVERDVQEIVVAEHCAAALAAAGRCDECGRRFGHKDSAHVVMRTPYGKLRVASPRWWTCPCSGGRRASFTPLARLLPERATPELALVEAKLAAHMSYAAAGDLLGELLPVGRRVHRQEPWRHVDAIGGRLDAELASEEYCWHCCVGVAGRVRLAW